MKRDFSTCDLADAAPAARALLLPWRDFGACREFTGRAVTCALSGRFITVVTAGNVVNFGELKVVGSSPEALVKLNGTKASLRPIAGTLPRGQTIRRFSQPGSGSVS